MNKKFKNFAIIWAIELIIFNILAFVTPFASGKPEFYSETVFWVEYAVMMVTLFVQLAVCYFAFKEKEEEKEEEIVLSTEFIRVSTAEAESILARCKSEETKAECKKVYEALRYSDPMSNEKLKEIEDLIDKNLAELRSAVVQEKNEDVKNIANELTLLINDRAIKCKLLK